MKFLLMTFASVRSILEIAQISISWLDEGNKMMINCAISEINAVKHKCSLVPSIICLTLCGPWAWSGSWQNISCKNLIRLAYEISILCSSFYLIYTRYYIYIWSKYITKTQHSDILNQKNSCFVHCLAGKWSVRRTVDCGTACCHASGFIWLELGRGDIRDNFTDKIFSRIRYIQQFWVLALLSHKVVVHYVNVSS